ncbi:MAG: tyrosine-type recombinase/integrase [Caldimicrobium sp.]
MIEIDNLIEEFIQYLAKEKNYSEHTLRAYGIDLREFKNFLRERGLCLENLSTSLVRQYFLYLKGTNLKASTLGRKISTLRSFLKFLLKRDFLKKNLLPKIYFKTFHSYLPFVPLEEEINQLIDKIPVEDFKFLRTRVIFELLYGSGLRISELVNLKLSDLNLEQNFIKVMGKGAKERIVPLSIKAKQVLISYLKERDKFLKEIKKESNYLFLNRRGGRLSERWVFEIVKKEGQKIGLFKLHPHALRHAFATHLLNAGMDIRAIQALLGHKALITTQKYTKVQYEYLLQSYLKAHPRAKATDDSF